MFTFLKQNLVAAGLRWRDVPEKNQYTPVNGAGEVIVELRTRLDDRARAEEIAELIVEERLAACAHVRGPLHSVYRWQGSVEQAEEYEIDAVTTAARLAALISRVQRLHPYELPAILTAPVNVTLPYAGWVAEQVN